ncbi:MAG: UDP-2,3-diacylglucosamine diphosphatase [Saprospiraceae bacterium]|nr:UDP-2,3-diacylglucosamine diphosphatase [Saprospiraceae bacterium]
MIRAYFASDFHLGADGVVTSRERELQICRWLDQIAGDVTHLFLVGDIFDFWYEYRSVVPRGHTRILGTLARLADDGVELHLFTGNHDLWMKGYLVDELGAKLHSQPYRLQLADKQFEIGHGDGLGPGDHGYKRLKRLFSSPIAQWMFSRLHPNLAFAMARFWSKKSRLNAPYKDRFTGKEGEWLVQYCEDSLSQRHTDYFVFGHRHIPIHCPLSAEDSTYINLGDWLRYNSYALFDGLELSIRFFESQHEEVLNL